MQRKQQLNAATVQGAGSAGAAQRDQHRDHATSARISASSTRRSIRRERKLDWNSRSARRRAAIAAQLHDDLLRKRLVDIYENGDLSYAEVLLSARSFTEFVERWEDLRLLINANEEAVRERRAAEGASPPCRPNSSGRALELHGEQQDQQRTPQPARRRLPTSGAIWSPLPITSAATLRREVAEMEELSASEEAQLEALDPRARARTRSRSARRRALPATTAPSGAPGAFSWPVSGTITSPFGWRSNPFGGAPEFHQGLDIAAPTGTTITASAGGTVMMAQWYGGYGNYILIDHGGGYSTGYGHLSAFYVSAGQQVKQGQAIGAVGCTGECTGPHVHFEIRINGKPVDPAPRLH